MIVTPSVDPQIALSLDQLVRLGLHPVVVLLDAESFGGAAGTKQIQDFVTSMSIPVCRVESAMDLTDALSQWGFKTLNLKTVL